MTAVNGWSLLAYMTMEHALMEFILLVNIVKHKDEFLLHRNLFRMAISVSGFLCGFTMTKLCAHMHAYKYLFLLFYQLTCN